MKMNNEQQQKEALAQIAEQVKIAKEAIAKAEALADEHTVQFGFNGETYYPKGDEIFNEENEDEYVEAATWNRKGPEKGAWMGSSDFC